MDMSLCLGAFETCDGFKLGRWVNVKRTTKSKGKLAEQQIASLDDLGFVWDVYGHLWEQGIARLRQYKAEHGHVLVPLGYETCDGFKLGRWVNVKRTTKSNCKLDKQQIASLNDLGFVGMFMTTCGSKASPGSDNTRLSMDMSLCLGALRLVMASTLAIG